MPWPSITDMWMKVKEAATKNKAVNLAIGVVGVAAAAALAASYFGGGIRGVVFAAIAVVTLLPLMVALLILGLATQEMRDNKRFGVAVMIFVYGFTIIAMAAAVLVFTSVFFGRPLKFLLPTDGPEFPTIDVHVPVNAALLDPFDPTKATEQIGFFRLPPHTIARFQSAEAIGWTNDPLDAIEALISQGPLLWDVSNFASEYERVQYDDEKFIEGYIRPYFRELVQMGLASDRDTLQKPFTSDSIEAYVRGEFLPLLKNRSNLIEGRFAIVRTDELDFLNRASWGRRPFWKRIVALRLKDADQTRRAFGPYFDVQASHGHPPTDKSRPFPCYEADANGGSLVALVFPLSGTPPTTAPHVRCQPFNRRDHTIRNGSDAELFVRLGINDDIPEDNGPGYANVRVILETVER